MKERVSVGEFYAGKSIFVTGASGLIGKVLIWKLLSSCPKLDAIYLLIRPKRGKNVQSRLDDLLQAPIFNNFRNENPAMLCKVGAVAGDISEEKLGLSQDDEHMLMNTVHVVFHIAAILKLDADLKAAVNMNTLGTLRLLQLANEMPKLEVFIHTSTAYCHCDVPVMEEKTYAASESPYDVIDLVRWMKPEVLDSLTEKLIKPHPNTYTYSKRLAELVAADFYPKLPVAIARPSIVIPAWREPIPGWVDNLNGPIGLMVGAGKGVIRTMWCNGEYEADLVPVDVVCNGLIVVGWKIGTEETRPKEMPVYNLTQMEMEPTTWQDIIDLGLGLIEVCPFETVLWYPGGGVYSNEYVHKFRAFMFHWIPAYALDFLLFLLGYKRFLVRVHEKVHHGQKVLQYFTTREWRFVKDNIMELKEILPSEDKKTFILTSKGLDRKDFMKKSMMVTRQYVLKEDPSSIPRAKARMRVLYCVDWLVRITFWLFVAWAVLRIINNVFGVYGNKKPVFV